MVFNDRAKLGHRRARPQTTLQKNIGAITMWSTIFSLSLRVTISLWSHLKCIENYYKFFKYIGLCFDDQFCAKYSLQHKLCFYIIVYIIEVGEEGCFGGRKSKWSILKAWY